MNKKKRNQAPPVAEINVRRKFYNENASMVYAIRYVEEHPASCGDVNQAILDTFHCLYAPLGVRAYGNSDEALQVAMRSISILQGHINYLQTVWGLTTTTVNNISYITPTNPSQNLAINVDNQDDHPGNHNSFEDGNQPGNSLTFEEQQALAIYQSFNQ